MSLNRAQVHQSNRVEWRYLPGEDCAGEFSCIPTRDNDTRYQNIAAGRVETLYQEETGEILTKKYFLITYL
jgi:hypothetical protein